MSRRDTSAAAVATVPDLDDGMDEIAPTRRRGATPAQASTAVVAAPTSGAKLVLLIGTGGVGKSVVARLLAEWAMEAERPLALVDADRHHSTLKLFYPDATRPEDGIGDVELSDAVMRSFFEQVLVGQIEQRASVIYDVTGGDTTFLRLAEDADLGSMLEKSNIMPVAIHVLSPRLQDLTDLAQMAEGGFWPAHTLLVLNEGRLGPAMIGSRAFEPIRNHRVYKAALNRGAVEVVLPALDAMAEVDRRRLTFAQAAAGTVKPRQTPLSPFDAGKVRTWLPRARAAFAPVAAWLP